MSVRTFAAEYLVLFPGWKLYCHLW